MKYFSLMVDVMVVCIRPIGNSSNAVITISTAEGQSSL